MILGASKCETAWEAVATITLAQSLNAELVHQQKGEIGNILDLTSAGEPEKELLYSEAYRQVERTKDYYGQVLARVSGVEYRSHRLVLPGFETREEAKIVLCPFGLNSGLDLPIGLWSYIARYLKSYGLTVYQMGDYGTRMEGLLFPENYIYSNRPLRDKLALLASAKVIVGVPNAWTMLSTAWDKKMVIYQPEDIPERRWAPWVHGGVHYFMYGRQQLHPILFLAASKKLIARF